MNNVKLKSLDLRNVTLRLQMTILCLFIFLSTVVTNLKMMPITILYQPPSTQNIDYGDTIDLTVTAITDPSQNLTYRWKHNNVEFLNPPPFVIYNSTTREAYINTSNLNIDQYESVRGTYIINVTHNFDYRVVEVNVVLREKPEEGVRLPPNVIIPDRPKVVYKKNKADFSLPCKAKGVPEPSYEWLRDGVPVIVSPQITFDSVRGDITFNDFTTRQEGVFTCVARSMFGTAIVKSFAPTYTLKQSRVDEFKSNATVSRVADEYSYIMLECKNKGEAVGEEIEYNWFDFGGSIIKIDERQFIDQNGNLHFAYVTTADGIRYKCGISATGLSYIQLGGTVLLSIKTIASPTAIAPQLQYTNSHTKFLRFSTARLECFFSGYEFQYPNVPVTKWYFDDGNEIKATGRYSFSADHRRLIIYNVDESDEKNYYCQAQNMRGTSNKEAVFLDITSSPIFYPNGAPVDQTMSEGKDAVFNCNARSARGETEPDPPVWYINGQQVGAQTDKTKFVFSDGNKKLTIKSLKKATDIMCIQCSVSNPVGTTWADGCLYVLSSETTTTTTTVATPQTIKEIEPTLPTTARSTTTATSSTTQTPTTTRTSTTTQMEGDFCDQIFGEDGRNMIFNRTSVGKSFVTKCPNNYKGNVTRLCQSNRQWGPINLSNCTAEQLFNAIQQIKQLEDVTDSSRKTETISNVTTLVTQSLPASAKIISGDIKSVVNILSKVGKATDDTSVSISQDTLKKVANITDKIISADQREWVDTNTETTLGDTGNKLIIAMEEVTNTFMRNMTDDKVYIVEQNVAIKIDRARDHIEFPPKNSNQNNQEKWVETTGNKLFLNKTAFNENATYSIIIYRNVSDKFQAKFSDEIRPESNVATTYISSDVISFSLSHEYTKLSTPVELTFYINKENVTDPICTFLNTKRNEWSTEGCIRTMFDGNIIKCSCDHLTNFAVLMSSHNLESIHHEIISRISYVGCIISIICLGTTVCVYFVLWRYVKSDRSVLHLNLSITLAIGYIIFLIGVNETKNKVGCTIVAALLHYIFQTVFFIMLAQGLLILKSVTSVKQTSILKYLIAMMYGAPLIIVVISLASTQTVGYGTDRACWLSPENGVIWAFAGPVMLILLFNFIILFIVLRVMQGSRVMMDKDLKQRTKSVMWSILVLSPILGVTWVFGIVSISSDNPVFHYLFALCNSLQGLSIFIFQCVLQYQVRDGIKSLHRRITASSMDYSQKYSNVSSGGYKTNAKSGTRETTDTQINSEIEMADQQQVES